MLSESIDEFVDKWQKLSLFNSQQTLPLAVKKTIRNERLAQQPFGLSASLFFMGTGSQNNYWPELSSFLMPILYIAGEFDYKFQQIAINMAKKAPDLTIILVKKAGHCVHLEQPQQFAKIISDWLF